MWPALLPAFVIGVLTRTADMVADDGLRMNRALACATGAAYGLLIAATIKFFPVLAPLGLAVMLSCLFTGKIDSTVHYAGLGAFALSAAMLGPVMPDPVLLAAFLGAGVADEVGNGLADRSRIRGPLASFFSLRLTMEAAALLISAYTGTWVFIASILSYDLGFTYIFAALKAVRGRAEG